MLGKTELLEAIAGKNRGLQATEGDRAAVLAAVARLEDRNPNPRPLEAPEKLAGHWRLAFTTSAELLGIERPPFTVLGQVYQSICVASGKLYNLAEVNNPLPGLAGFVAVAARFEAASERRATVKFERVALGLQSLAGYRRDPAEFVDRWETGETPRALGFDLNPDRQQGWLDVTYLDDDLRVGRGNGGSTFVLVRA